LSYRFWGNRTLNESTAKWWALIGLGLAIFILNVDMTIVNVALPIIGQHFKASIIELQWINNVYLLSMACSVIIMGKLADIHGSKKVFCYGILIFFTGSLIAGISPNTFLLILGRIIQGIGMAMSFPIAVVLANRLFLPHQRSMAIGILITFTGIGQALGPTLGGFITEFWGWRFAFLINLPICLITFFLILYFCNKDVLPSIKRGIHYFSASLLALALILWLLAFNQLANWGADSVGFITCIVVGLILLIALVLLQTRLKDPLINLKIFKNRTFSVINIIRPLFQYAFTAIIFILPLYLQNILGFNPFDSGLIILISTVVMGIVGPFTGRVIPHTGVRLPIMIAQFFGIVGFLLLLFNGAQLNWPALVIGLCLIGADVGIMFSATNYTAVNSVEESVRGMGFGVFVTVAFFFSALGVALSGTILSTLSLNKFNALLASNNLQIDVGSLRSVISGAHPITNLSSWLPVDKLQTIKPLVVQSFSRAFHAILIVLALLSCFALIAASFLKELDQKKS